MRTHSFRHSLMKALTVVSLGATAMTGCRDETTRIAGPDPDPFEPFNPTAEEFKWRGQIAPGHEIEIKAVAGHIQASRALGADVEVYATKRGRHDRAADVRIEVVHHADGVTICTVYPDRPSDPPNECGPSRGGVTSSHDNDVEVEFTVFVPAGVRFVGRTIAGNIEAHDLASDAALVSVAGNLHVRTTGLAEASTIGGSVTAYIGSADWDRDLTFASITGDVCVQVPSTTNADVEATAPNGILRSDFPLTETNPGLWEGTLGTGGPNLTLSSVNGDLTLAQGS